MRVVGVGGVGRVGGGGGGGCGDGWGCGWVGAWVVRKEMTSRSVCECAKRYRKVANITNSSTTIIGRPSCKHSKYKRKSTSNETCCFPWTLDRPSDRLSPARPTEHCPHGTQTDQVIRIPVRTEQKPYENWIGSKQPDFNSVVILVLVCLVTCAGWCIISDLINGAFSQLVLLGFSGFAESLMILGFSCIR